jgi:NTP pyrophosphatase (non-canonical NTP hydrolase)
MRLNTTQGGKNKGMAEQIKSIDEIQKEAFEWTDYNFPNAEKWEPLLGAVEELGELAHAYLKMHQGIRGNAEQHLAEAQDAIGYVMIYLLHFCSMHGWSMARILNDTWEQVKQRDWQANKETGEVK